MGGAQRVASILLGAWAARGDDVLVLSFGDKNETSFFPLDPRIARESLGLLGKTGNVFSRNFDRLKVLRQKISDFHPDVAVSFLAEINVCAILATRGLGIPVIVSERENPYKGTVNFVWRVLRRLTYPFVTRLICQTEEAQGYFGRFVPSQVIPNPLTLPEKQERTHGKDQCQIVALGRLIASKKFEDVIACFAQIAEKYPDTRLTIWGEGPEREALSSLAKQGSGGERVFLPGHTSNPFPVLAQADIFILSSETEGFPNALFEAMAMGVACITSDCSSSLRGYVVDGQNALLYPVGDVEALGKALERLVKDSGLRLSLSQEAKKVGERLSLPTILAEWDKVFKQSLE